MADVEFYSTTMANYLALEEKNTNALYFLDNGQLYKGDMLLSNNVVLIDSDSDYPTVGVINTFYAKTTGECAYWDGNKYVLISKSVMSELEALENRINETIHLALTSKGVDVDGLIQATIIRLENYTAINVGNYAFYQYPNLTVVNLPNVISVGSYAFQGCTALTSTDLSSANSIGNYAFQACTGLTSIELSSATSIGSNSFAGCSSLTTVILPKITSVGSYAFQGCTALTSIELSSATSIATYAFQSCKQLLVLELPNVTSIGTYTFQNCTSLTSIDLSSVTSIGQFAFQNCTSLVTLELPSVISIGSNSFYGCSSLTTVILPKITIIDASAFINCSNLISLIISNDNGEVATLKTTNAFNNTPIVNGAGYIYVPDDLVDDYKSATNWSTYKDQIKCLSELPPN